MCRRLLALGLLSTVSAGSLAACAAGTPRPDRALEPGTATAAELDDRAMLLQLVDRKDFEPWLVEQFADRSSGIREALAISLGRIGDPRALPLLRSLLADEVPAVRRAAALALGRLGDPEAVPALLRAVADRDRETARLAVEALARCGAGLGAVVAAVASVEPAEEREPRLLPALFRFDEDGAVDVARRTLESDEAELRRWAVYALAREPRPAALPDLRRLLHEADVLVRAWSARALGRIGDPEDLDRLLPLLSDGEPGPIVEALRAGQTLIERTGAASPTGWLPELERLLDDARSGVRLTAIEASGSWLPDESLRSRLAARVEQGELRERELALLALARDDASASSRMAVAMAEAPEPVLRAAAAEAAAATGDLALVDRLACDAEPGVRLRALTAALERRLEVPSEWAARGLRDPHWAVRAATFDWLAGHPVVAVAKLQEAAAKAPTSLVWRAAIPAIAARSEAASGERSDGVATLRGLSRATGYLLRREAAEALRSMGLAARDPNPVETGKPRAAYRDTVQRTRERPVVELETSRGTLRIRLECPDAPLTCWNFLQLAAQGFYDGLGFHRVVPHFVVQAGDPTGTGRGGPGYQIRDEPNGLRYVRGAVGMAHDGPDTAGSQFFITLAPQPHLDGAYTLFGNVVEGLESLDRIVQGDEIVQVRRMQP